MYLSEETGDVVMEKDFENRIQLYHSWADEFIAGLDRVFLCSFLFRERNIDFKHIFDFIKIEIF